MKSILNIPVMKRDNPNNNSRWRRFLEPSVILSTLDRYFGKGYELYEHNYRTLITKNLTDCYKMHTIFIQQNPECKYINAHDYYTL